MMKLKPYRKAIMAEMLARNKKKEPTLGMKVAAIILTHAEKRNVNIYDLLSDIGVHQSVFARWRIGQTTPSLDVVARIQQCGVRVLG
jgi:ribosome-binding protein aMBF1 (putative translation factor)